VPGGNPCAAFAGKLRPLKLFCCQIFLGLPDEPAVGNETFTQRLCLLACHRLGGSELERWGTDPTAIREGVMRPCKRPSRVFISVPVGLRAMMRPQDPLGVHGITAKG
jgi:hypothetical protein